MANLLGMTLALKSLQGHHKSVVPSRCLLPLHSRSFLLQVSGLPTPDVAWYLNGRLVHPDDFHKMIVSEKGFHSFIFEIVQVSDAGTWECVAFNRAGEASFTVQLDVIGTGVLGYFTC